MEVTDSAPVGNMLIFFGIISEVGIDEYVTFLGIFPVQQFFFVLTEEMAMRAGLTGDMEALMSSTAHGRRRGGSFPRATFFWGAKQLQ